MSESPSPGRGCMLLKTRQFMTPVHKMIPNCTTLLVTIIKKNWIKNIWNTYTKRWTYKTYNPTYLFQKALGIWLWTSLRCYIFVFQYGPLGHLTACTESVEQRFYEAVNWWNSDLWYGSHLSTAGMSIANTYFQQKDVYKYIWDRQEHKSKTDMSLLRQKVVSTV